VVGNSIIARMRVDAGPIHNGYVAMERSARGGGKWWTLAMVLSTIACGTMSILVFKQHREINHLQESVDGLHETMSANLNAQHDMQTNTVSMSKPINVSVPIDLSVKFARGMILMFSGDLYYIPADWALCDGTKGTPDLRGRFVRACTSSEVSGCDMHAWGDGSHSTNSSGIHQHGGATGGHAVTTEEMPKHRHEQGTRELSGNVYYDHGAPSSSYSDGFYRYRFANGHFIHPWTSTEGGGAAHTHRILAGGAHMHKFDPTPPYYSLAYIMFLGPSS